MNSTTDQTNGQTGKQTALGSEPTAGLTDNPTITVTVADAAKLLELSAEAVRMRVKRGTLASNKIAGTVYVLLDRANLRTNNQPHERTNNQPNNGPNHRTNDRPNEDLVEGLREQVAAHEEQIRWLRREVERKDAILLRMAERIPELEAPRDAPHGPDTPPGDVGGTETPAGDTDEPRRSWWRRFFGLE